MERHRRDGEPLLRLEGITKVYPGVVANRNVSFDLREGEIHAVCGENGAGKSTLMKIIFGMERPSEGRILLRGEEVHIRSSQRAIELGIGMVHQHFMLVPSFTVAENLVLGIEPAKFTKIDRNDAIRRTRDIAERYNLRVSPEAKVAEITVAMMQKLEILKALYRGAKILILDEPSAVLTPQETEELFEELVKLRDRGHTIVFISHKLKEVKRISDRVTVMRRGEVTGSCSSAEVSEERISELMIGRVPVKERREREPRVGEVALSVRDLTLRSPSGKVLLDHMSFALRRGEILGVAGVEGNGQTELVRIVTGSGSAYGGEVRYHGIDGRGKGIGELRSLGLSYIPEDRIRTGSAAAASVWENLITNRIDDGSFARRSVLRRRAVKAHADRLVEEFDISCPDVESAVATLSGGNMQKVVVARECSDETTILVADQPTRGVDVGAALRIREKIRHMSRAGTAILLVSADLAELLEICTRLVVVFEGRITASFDRIEELDETELGFYMLGIKEQEPTA
ncbi:MAG: ABC transporter ATP-binding protein [Spirochaetales bacterium]|nr:ABC transporter ATP-binding protein [Spirochaetales bacterium]